LTQAPDDRYCPAVHVVEEVAVVVHVDTEQVHDDDVYVNWLETPELPVYELVVACWLKMGQYKR